jgi:asparagine synthase (glutamine-hydrolysing)
VCGIAGIIDYDRPVEAVHAELLAMQRALAHRGPDGEGLHQRGAVSLAHTRLAVHSPKQNPQPRLSPDGRYVLIFNGELYNREEIAHRYAREFPFEDETDTEAILAALALDGEEALSLFNGMFALFFWDHRERKGLLARDLLGVKPLLYERISRRCVRFASEAKALLAARPAGSRPSLHTPSLMEWVVMPSFSGVEHGMFEGIEVVPAGHLIRVSDRGLEPKRWGSFQPAKKRKPVDVLLDAVLRNVWTGIYRTAAAEVPIGAFLSGGFDSTLVTAVAALENESLPTFTVRFEGQDRFDYAHSQITLEDDTPFAQMAAAELKLPNTLVEVPRSNLARDLEELARINDALPAWEQELAQHHLSRAASAQVKAVLVGDAADETHFGYHFLLDDEATASPEALMKRLGAHERMRLLSPELLQGRDADLLGSLAERYRALAEANGQRWGDRNERIAATSSLVVQRWLGRLLHNGDVHTMAFGLEARVPFADVDLLRMAESVSPEIGLHQGIEKWHLRQAMGGEMPDKIRWRKKSALPKDQGTESIYRAEAQRLLKDDDRKLSRWLNLDVIRELASLGRPLTELERAMLFQAICFWHFVRHHAVV